MLLLSGLPAECYSAFCLCLVDVVAMSWSTLTSGAYPYGVKRFGSDLMRKEPLQNHGRWLGCYYGGSRVHTNCQSWKDLHQENQAVDSEVETHSKAETELRKAKTNTRTSNVYNK